jgi:hypothetical protein
MSLKEQDILVLLKLIASDARSTTYRSLASSLCMSLSEIHASLKRAAESGLLNPLDRVPNRQALLELLIHGLKYVFPAKRGRTTRGLPTAHAAPPLASHIIPSGDLPPVWPDPDGTVRGESFSPLYKSAPAAAKKDPALYELLALVDAIRGGRARERQIAEEELRARVLQ